MAALDRVSDGDRVSTAPAASPEDVAGGRAFELRESKLRPPTSGDAAVPRRLVEQRLTDAAAVPIVVVHAGAGYGKTTTLVQWARSSGRPVAWLSLDGNDNDPITLLTYVAAALDRQVGIDETVFQALDSPGLSLEAAVIPRLGAALSAVTAPLLLILDDAHEIQDQVCLDALVALALDVPAGVQMVLSTRDASALPLGVWRTRGLCVEIGAQDLRMDGAEARALLDATGGGCSDDGVAELVRRTEGWPAGLYLAGLSAGTEGLDVAPTPTITGNDPHVADFLRSELLAAIPPEQLELLTRTSLLEPLSGPMCDAVLERTGSAELLETLERTNRFVVALDRERTLYRCHHLVRDLLAEEFARTSPDDVAPLLRRASDWSLAHGRVVEGIGYAQRAGEVDQVAHHVLRWGLPTSRAAERPRSSDGSHGSGRMARASGIPPWRSWPRCTTRPRATRPNVIAGRRSPSVTSPITRFPTGAPPSRDGEPCWASCAAATARSRCVKTPPGRCRTCPPPASFARPCCSWPGSRRRCSGTTTAGPTIS